MDQNLLYGNSSNLHGFLNHLPHVQRLEVQSYFLKYLAAGIVQEKLPNPCFDLTYLSIRINFNDPEENVAALSLLKSSPNLQELELLARPEDHGVVIIAANQREPSQWDCSFVHLRLVKPALERMIVKPASLNRGIEILRELLQFKRVSPHAEMIFLDP